jgi:hypothetical protein
MTAIRRRLLPATARRLFADAGPPRLWVVSAFAAGAALGLVLTYQHVRPTISAALVVFIVTIPALLDTDGWRIRLGMAWLALEQRRRMPDLPRTPRAADRWLAEHTTTDSPLLRASILMTAGRNADARQTLEAAPRDTAEDRARISRMLAAIDGLETGTLDPGPALAAIEELPPDLRRYHRLSLAWSVAWVESAQRRPWRRAFAEASRGIRPGEIPTRILIGLSAYELLATLVVALVVVVALAIGWR